MRFPFQFRNNYYIKPFWHISALVASRWKQSGRAKVPIFILITISILFIVFQLNSSENIELLTNPTLVIPGLLDRGEGEKLPSVDQ